MFLSNMTAQRIYIFEGFDQVSGRHLGIRFINVCNRKNVLVQNVFKVFFQYNLPLNFDLILTLFKN